VLASIVEPVMPASLDMFGQPPTYEAYKEIMEGQQSFYLWDFQKAIQHYSRAAEIDPSQKALALTRTAIVYLNIGDYGKTYEFAKEAEKIQDMLSPFQKSYLEWANAELKGDLNAQLRIARQNADTRGGSFYNQWAWECIFSNRPQEAVYAFKKHHPESLWAKMTYEWWDDIITRAYHMLGKHKNELKQARRYRKQYPDDIRALPTEARALAAMGKMDEINKLVDESFTLKQEPGYKSGNVILDTGRELKTHGFRNESIQLLERGIRWLNERPKGESTTAPHRFELAHHSIMSGDGRKLRVFLNRSLKRIRPISITLGISGLLLHDPGIGTKCKKYPLNSWSSMSPSLKVGRVGPRIIEPASRR